MKNGRCHKCKERRCKKHCKCGRDGQWAPRSGPRSGPGAAAAEAAPVAAPTVAPAVRTPVGRPAPLTVKDFGEGEWLDAAIAEIPGASSLDVATMIFDDPGFAAAVERKLRGRSEFSCSIVVDRAQYEQRTSRYQRPLLRHLASLGADVRLCDGLDGAAVFGAGAYRGIMHTKAIVLNNRIAYTGSSNITRASRVNRELVLRVTGPPVADIAQRLLSAKEAGDPELA